MSCGPHTHFIGINGASGLHRISQFRQLVTSIPFENTSVIIPYPQIPYQRSSVIYSTCLAFSWTVFTRIFPGVPWFVLNVVPTTVSYGFQEAPRSTVKLRCNSTWRPNRFGLPGITVAVLFVGELAAMAVRLLPWLVGGGTSLRPI